MASSALGQDRAMTAQIIPAERLAAMREERERQRREQEAVAGSILGDDEDEQPSEPASPAQTRETNL